ncbi:MAG: hypothetical protein NC548_61360 [Lachnospiraceae bacterium]|nr:hypothetical protein [Lachnospiraceae bacterium]
MNKEYKYKVGQYIIYQIDYQSKGRYGVVIGVNPENGNYIIRWCDGQVSDNMAEYLLYPIDPPKPESEIMFSVAKLRKLMNKIVDEEAWLSQEEIDDIIGRLKEDRV